MFKRKKKIFAYSLLTLIIAIILGLTGASAYLYYFAFEPQKPLNSGMSSKKKTPLKHDKKWLAEVDKQRWQENSAGQNLRLKAVYIPAAHKTNKTIIVAHGYQEEHTQMASYLHMFHQMGYNVLAPDDRGAGKSQGKYIGFGWPDRLDYVKWIKQVVKKGGSDSQIGLFGVSMGGATVMMTSGEQLPHQVKAIVEDSGYSSIEEELTYELKQRFGIPKQPLITTASWFTQMKAGFDFKKGSSVKQLKKNKLPIFFIHGGADKFVPTKMVYQNYRATTAYKELWVAPKTGHAMAYYEYPKVYRQKVGNFFKQWLK
ncbi:cell surface hydrolase, membrane-bound [Liquorilactobacillus aquaticus DSM 21051]|uniref:Cell surface hydrolase, membrane-bound n=1 Tax=Liquorilactobacillus aquaticus DSM 21051 TaxID=1423725 RepID=A0A0R2D0J7_9LACO|nr:alpha/beta hydrolase [Liquorilactobacillus aquaticus]KRM97521.1 cell surface hydrolase, membrane-bound [Liquorilactobacillus aquaticus DSM 21051]